MFLIKSKARFTQEAPEHQCVALPGYILWVWGGAAYKWQLFQEVWATAAALPCHRHSSAQHCIGSSSQVFSTSHVTEKGYERCFSLCIQFNLVQVWLKASSSDWLDLNWSLLFNIEKGEGSVEGWIWLSLYRRDLRKSALWLAWFPLHVLLGPTMRKGSD